MLEGEERREIGLIVEKKMKAARILKYSDTAVLASNSTVTVGFQGLCINITQGAAQGQRTGDSIRYQKLEIAMNVTGANADIFNIVRIMFFVWKPNTLAVAPTGVTIFSSTATQGPYTPLNFENKADYSTIEDFRVNISGTAASPTNNSQHFIHKVYNLQNRKAQYNLGLTTGTGLLFFTNYSDSAVVPFPVYNLVTRVWYYDD